MARTHQLISNSAASSYDFLTGVLMVVDSWRWQYTRDGKVVETATLAAGNGTADDDIEDAVNGINYLGKLARDWVKDKQNTESVWYHLYGDDEVSKRSLVDDVQCVSLPNGMHSPLLGTGAAFYQLTITRSAVWEDASAQTVAATLCSALGGHIDLPAIDGDLDARVERLAIRANKDVSPDTAQVMTRCWFGMKPIYTGSTGFSGLHECEDFSIDATCSPLPANTSDASASGGYKIQWTTSATWQRMIYASLNGIISPTYVSSYRGRYQVLLRCKVSSTEDVRIQMRWGYGNATVSLGDRYISNTNYDLIEMGEISIPAGTWRAAAAVDGLSRNAGVFELYAQHMNTSVTLSLDCIILIPTYAHGYGDGTYIGYMATDFDDGTFFYTFEDGERNAINFEYNGSSLAGLAGGVQADFQTFYYLRDGGPLVFAAQRDTGQDIDDTVKIEITYRRRYVNHAEPIP
ncbi:MAG: hypothetical protein ACOYYS_10030 [Chloroflexota bacterium]